jgi:predicted amidohydrolase
VEEMKDKIKLALCQISSKGENKKNCEDRRINREGKTARGRHSTFSEMSLTGYVSHDQVYELAETMPGPSTENWCLGKRRGCT